MIFPLRLEFRITHTFLSNNQIGGKKLPSFFSWSKLILVYDCRISKPHTLEISFPAREGWDAFII